MTKIVPHLWFDTQALNASAFYLSLFENSKLLSHSIIKDTPSGDCDFLVIELAGQEFMLISAGPYFPHSPAVSFQVACSRREEVDLLYERLSKGENIPMPLDIYDFNQRTTWVRDEFGISWQLFVSSTTDRQKITPTLMFTGDLAGKAKEAIEFYTGIFKNSTLDFESQYDENPAPNNTKTFGFTLEGHKFAALDGPSEPAYAFSEAISFLVYAENQEEIDSYWKALSAVAEAEQCGWLKDKYGFSWQISPRIMDEMMMDTNEERLNAVTQSMLQMKKIDVEELKRVYHQF